MDAKCNIIADVCSAITSSKRDVASDLLRTGYPFIPLNNSGRSYSIQDALNVFIRDGFVDRYSGARLVFPPTLRLISLALPSEFPFHRNWRMDACHIAFYELAATIDHIVPICRGGNNSLDNLVTTSMVKNSAKANFTIEELGWSLLDVGVDEEWDGLLGWFISQTESEPSVQSNAYFRQWFRAAKKATTNIAPFGLQSHSQ
jgi:hypothetical protein